MSIFKAPQLSRSPPPLSIYGFLFGENFNEKRTSVAAHPFHCRRAQDLGTKLRLLFLSISCVKVNIRTRSIKVSVLNRNLLREAIFFFFFSQKDE